MVFFVNKLKGVVFLVLLFVSSFLGALVFGGFLLPIFFLRPAIFRHLYDNMIGLWFWFAAVRFFLFAAKCCPVLHILFLAGPINASPNQGAAYTNHRLYSLAWLERSRSFALKALRGPFKNPKDGESRRKTAKYGERRRKT